MAVVYKKVLGLFRVPDHVEHVLEGLREGFCVYPDAKVIIGVDVSVVKYHEGNLFAVYHTESGG